MGSIQTVFLLSRLDEEDLITALKRGRMNARFGGIELEEFTALDPATGKKGYMGEEIEIRDKIKIVLKGNWPEDRKGEAQIQVIRDGELLRLYHTKETRFDFQLEDEPPRKRAKTYYRVIITGNRGEVVSNPIFITFGK